MKIHVTFLGKIARWKASKILQKKMRVRTKMLKIYLVKIGVFIKFKKRCDVKIPVI